MPEGILAFYSRSVFHGGIERNFIRQANVLKDAGFNIVVIAPKSSSIAKSLSNSAIDFQPIENENIITLWSITRLLINKKVKALYIYRPKELRATIIIKLLSGLKIKIVFYQQEKINFGQSRFFKTLLLKWTDFWLTPMTYLSNEIHNQPWLSKREIRVIPHCLNLKPLLSNQLSVVDARQQLDLPADRKIIGILGRQNLEKRQDFLIRAINFLKLNNYSFDLLILGVPKRNDEQEYTQFLKELASECGIENQVYFSPYVEDIITFYRSIDVYVKTTSGEACDITAIEALASGTQVLAVQSKYNSDILGKGDLGMLYKANNLEDFSDKLIKILTRPKIIDYLKTEGLKAVNEKYDIDNNKHKLIQFATELLS